MRHFMAFALALSTLCASGIAQAQTSAATAEGKVIRQVFNTPFKTGRAANTSSTTLARSLNSDDSTVRGLAKAAKGKMRQGAWGNDQPLNLKDIYEKHETAEEATNPAHKFKRVNRPRNARVTATKTLNDGLN